MGDPTKKGRASAGSRSTMRFKAVCSEQFSTKQTSNATTWSGSSLAGAIAGGGQQVASGPRPKAYPEGEPVAGKRVGDSRHRNARNDLEVAKKVKRRVWINPAGRQGTVQRRAFSWATLHQDYPMAIRDDSPAAQLIPGRTPCLHVRLLKHHRCDDNGRHRATCSLQSSPAEAHLVPCGACRNTSDAGACTCRGLTLCIRHSARSLHTDAMPGTSPCCSCFKPQA